MWKSLVMHFNSIFKKSSCCIIFYIIWCSQYIIRFPHTVTASFLFPPQTFFLEFLFISLLYKFKWGSAGGKLSIFVYLKMSYSLMFQDIFYGYGILGCKLFIYFHSMLKITFHFLLVSMATDGNQPSSSGAPLKDNQYFLSGCFKDLLIDFGVWSFTAMYLGVGFFLFNLLGSIDLEPVGFHLFWKVLSY